MSQWERKPKRGNSFHQIWFFLLFVMLVVGGYGLLDRLVGDTPSSQSSHLVIVPGYITATPDPNMTPALIVVTQTPLSDDEEPNSSKEAYNYSS